MWHWQLNLVVLLFGVAALQQSLRAQIHVRIFQAFIFAQLLKCVGVFLVCLRNFVLRHNGIIYHAECCARWIIHAFKPANPDSVQSESKKQGNFVYNSQHLNIGLALNLRRYSSDIDWQLIKWVLWLSNKCRRWPAAEPFYIRLAVWYLLCTARPPQPAKGEK